MAVVVFASCGAGDITGGTGGGSAAGGTGGSGGGASGGGVATGGGSSGTGGGSTTGGNWCQPCIDSSDCETGALCLGTPGHCGRSCNSDSECPSGVSCTPLNIGKAPAGSQCMPQAPQCDVTTKPAGLTCTDGWTGFVNGFFQTNCRGCHQAGFDTPSDVMGGAQYIRMAVERRSMPPGVDGPSDADRRRLFTWMACGNQAPPSGVH